MTFDRPCDALGPWILLLIGLLPVVSSLVYEFGVTLLPKIQGASSLQPEFTVVPDSTELIRYYLCTLLSRIIKRSLTSSSSSPPSLLADSPFSWCLLSKPIAKEAPMHVHSLPGLCVSIDTLSAGKPHLCSLPTGV